MNKKGLKKFGLMTLVRDLEYPNLATCSSHESPIAQELKLPATNWNVEGPIPVEGSEFFLIFSTFT